MISFRLLKATQTSVFKVYESPVENLIYVSEKWAWTEDTKWALYLSKTGGTKLSAWERTFLGNVTIPADGLGQRESETKISAFR